MAGARCWRPMWTRGKSLALLVVFLPQQGGGHLVLMVRKSSLLLFKQCGLEGCRKTHPELTWVRAAPCRHMQLGAGAGAGHAATESSHPQGWSRGWGESKTPNSCIFTDRNVSAPVPQSLVGVPQDRAASGPAVRVSSRSAAWGSPAARLTSNSSRSALARCPPACPRRPSLQAPSPGEKG